MNYILSQAAHQNGRVEHMRKARRRALASLAAIPAIGMAVAMLPGPASAKNASTYYTKVQAGYAATGAHFHGVKADFSLPAPSKFASELKRVEITVELWSSNRVMELGAWARTTSSSYHVTAWVWDRATKTLVCSTSSSTRRCPGTPSGWSSRTFPAGTYLMLSIYFHVTVGKIRFNVYNWTKPANYDYYYKAGTQAYGQARVGAELGCSPWRPCGGASQIPYTAPATLTRLIQSDDTEVYPVGSLRSGLFGNFNLHKVVLTSDGTSTGTAEVAPSYPIKGKADYAGGQFNLNLLP